MIKWFANFKIGVRIIIGFLLVAFIACAIGGVGIFNLTQINGTYKVAYSDSVDALKYIERISSSFQRARLNIYGVVLADNRDEKEYHIERMEYFDSIIEENMTAYRDLLSSYKAEEVEIELALIDKVQSTFEAYNEKETEFLNGIAMESNRKAEAYDLLKKGGEINNLSLAVDDAITELVNYNINYAENQIANNGSQATNSTVVMAITAILGVLLAILVGVFISRGISKPIGKIVAAADKLAVGDLDITINIDTKDEIGQLAGAFQKLIESTREQALIAERIANADLTVEVTARSEKDILGKSLIELVNSLNEIIANINSASEQVAAGSKQISDSSMALSQGATEQASSIEELTASIEEIASQTKLIG